MPRRRFVDGDGFLTSEGERLISLRGASAEVLLEAFPNDNVANLRSNITQLTKKLDDGSLRHRHGAPEVVEDDARAKPGEKRANIEVRYDGQVVINWSDRTIITDLGKEFGTFMASFDIHKAIQRAYSDMYEDKGENQEEIAMRFDFPNARAVSRYLKIHSIRHSSLPQTDIEFEAGETTEEEAVEETVRSLRRRVHKKTRQQIWKDTQADADKWRHFEDSVLVPLREDIKANLPRYKPPRLKLKHGRVGPRIVVNGLSDLHFGKYGFEPDGSDNYSLEIAVSRALETARELIEQTTREGKPERFLLPMGTDNFHIDTVTKTTTRGTPQDVQGEYETLIKPYIELMIDFIELHRQVAPVDVVVMPGNHDYVTSLWLGHLLRYRYEDADDVNVIMRSHPTVYLQYGNYGLGFTHGDPMFTSPSKQERNIHKMFLSEAKKQGVNIHLAEHFYMFAGNLHFEQSRDFGGMVSYEQMPALCGDDRWHKENIYTGTRKQTVAYVIDLEKGLVAKFYAKGE